MFPYKASFQSIDDASNLTQSSVPVVGSEAQWMSQGAYQNTDLEKVDWAALAQQWIYMKTTSEPAANNQVPHAPPPPRISKPEPVREYEEQGEAPMEVERDDEQAQDIAPPAPTNIFPTNNWVSGNADRPQTHSKQWQKKPNRWNQSHPHANANSGNHQTKSHRMHANDEYSSQGPNIRPANSTWETPPSANMPNNPFARTNSSNEFKMHGVDANPKSGIQLENIDLNSAPPPLDAAQRKTLPAWIRDGLEKMEREKFKQAERDREMKERDQKRKQDKLIERSLLMQLNAADPASAMIPKSKFDSDSESDDDHVNSDHNEKVVKGSKTSAPVAAVASTATVGSSSMSSSSAPVPMFKPHRTKGEILTEIMLSVRKNLTEILLEVTNEEIYAIAQDTLSKVRLKGRKAQTVQKNAITANASALGLVTYDDSDASRSDGESDADNDARNASDVDSEFELKKSIHRKKLAFETKSTEIELYLAETEEKEKQWLEDDNEQTKSEESNQLDEQSTSSTSNASVLQQQQKSIDSGEIQHDKNKLQIGAQRTERKGSRFSDAKGFLYNVGSSQASSDPSNQSGRLKSFDHPAIVKDAKAYESKKDKDKSKSHDSDSPHKNKSSRGHHRRHHRDSRSPSDRKHKRSKRRRSSSSSSSDRSSYSRNSPAERSRKHSSKRERSSSDDRTSKSSRTSSYKSDKYSREKGSRSEYKKSRRSRSRSHDRSSSRRHR